MHNQALTPAPKRRWFRWSLRTLFVVVTALACWMGWNLHCVHERHRIQELPGVTSGNGPATSSEPLPRLWLAFGAIPQDFVTLPDDTNDAQMAKAAWLFPEARVLHKRDCGAISFEFEFADP